MLGNANTNNSSKQPIFVQSKPSQLNLNQPVSVKNSIVDQNIPSSHPMITRSKTSSLPELRSI